MMTKPLLAILLLLLVACDPGETLTELLDERPDGLDGKGLVCERLNLPWRTRPRWVNYPYDGFRFVDGEVEWDMIAQGTVDAPENAVSARVSTVANAGYKGYSQSRTEIFWWGDWFVSRKCFSGLRLSQYLDCRAESIAPVDATTVR